MTPLRQKLIDELDLRGYSKHTVLSYVGVLSRLARHFNKSPDKLTDNQLKEYLLWRIRDKKRAASTMCVTVSAMRFFYKHVLHRSTASVEEVLPRMRASIARARVYTPEEVDRIINAPKVNLRHRVMLMTTYGAGLRVSEVCQLKAKDILTSQMLIRVAQGKGRKDRYVPLAERLLEELRKYWRAYRPTEWLFPSFPDTTRPVSAISVRNAFERAVRLAGLPNLHGIHSLRHSFATHSLEAGVNVVTLQRLLGHTNLSTTSKYLHLRPEHLAKTQSPLDRLPSSHSIANHK
jgi:site-specific recombinase XerD